MMQTNIGHVDRLVRFTIAILDVVGFQAIAK